MGISSREFDSLEVADIARIVRQTAPKPRGARRAPTDKANVAGAEDTRARTQAGRDSLEDNRDKGQSKLKKAKAGTMERAGGLRRFASAKLMAARGAAIAAAMQFAPGAAGQVIQGAAAGASVGGPAGAAAGAVLSTAKATLDRVTRRAGDAEEALARTRGFASREERLQKAIEGVLRGKTFAGRLRGVGGLARELRTEFRARVAAQEAAIELDPVRGSIDTLRELTKYTPTGTGAQYISDFLSEKLGLSKEQAKTIREAVDPIQRAAWFAELLFPESDGVDSVRLARDKDIAYWKNRDVNDHPAAILALKDMENSLSKQLKGETPVDFGSLFERKKPAPVGP